MQLAMLLAMVSLRASQSFVFARGRRCQASRITRLHSEEVDSTIELLQTPNSKINAYWIDQLRRVDKPAARKLIHKLVPDNVLGYVSSTTMIEKIKGYRERFDDKVILTRCGDFYEAYGIDAVMLVAWAGANPMYDQRRYVFKVLIESRTSKGDVQAKAGCPKQNIQNTLDGLTEAGLSVAVIEELPDSNANAGPTRKNQPKERGLAQVVSPSLRTYAYGSIMRTEDIAFLENRPAVGIHSIPPCPDTSSRYFS